MGKNKSGSNNVNRPGRAERAFLAALFAFFMFCGEQYRSFGTIFGTFAKKPGIIPDTEKTRSIPWPEMQYQHFCTWFDVVVPYGKPVRYLLLWGLIFAAVSLIAFLTESLFFCGNSVGPDVSGNRAKQAGSAGSRLKTSKTGKSRGERISFRAEWILILAAWSPYLIIRYPAGIDWDAYHQIAQALGYEQMTSHWPPFVAWLMGGFAAFGQNVLRSVNAGVFLFSVFQTCIISLILVRSLAFIRKHASAAFEYVILAIYMFSPVYAGYLTTVVKDGFFAAFTVLLLIQVTELVLNTNTQPLNSPGKNATVTAGLKIGITALLVCLTRNNGSILVGFMLLVSLYYLLRVHKSDIKQADGAGAKKAWKGLIITLLTVLVIYKGYQNALTRMNIRPGSVTVSLSAPFQQTARYLTLFPEDVSEEERKEIDQALHVDELPTLYAPLLSDPVKDTYRESRRGLIPYFKAWITMGLRHPGVYVDATIHNTYGFFDPFSRQLEHPYGLTTGALNANENLQFTYPEELEQAVEMLRKYVAFLEDFPVTGIFCNVQLQMWLAIALVIAAFAGKPKFIFAAMTAVSLLILVDSPTWAYNGFRYTLPIVMMNPVLLTIHLSEIKKRSAG